MSQSLDDRARIKNIAFENEEFSERVVKYGFTKDKKTYNPLYHILSSSMYLYQKLISPQLSRGCAFNPSCSEYSKDLIKEYGIIKGAFLSSDRITRCTRISLADKSNYHFDTHDGKMHETVERYRKRKNDKDSNVCNH
ncbi:MAG: membrane protein insertion efficiency factor YidD [Bacteroidales bacterium]|nr:membrane protein insertion efficiency factor YidD [Bacteroidales bacterium]